jgi:hypothetical protein
MAFSKTIAMFWTLLRIGYDKIPSRRLTTTTRLLLVPLHRTLYFTMHGQKKAFLQGSG